MARKNLIFICTDQMRYDALSINGNTHLATPNIDGIGHQGTTLGRHYTPNQICSPSRATMATGLYPRHHGLWRNGVTLDPATPNLWTFLRNAGFRTHAAGKLHYQPLLAPDRFAMPESLAFWQRPDADHWRGPFYGFETVDLVLGEANESTKAGHYANWLRSNHPGIADLYEPEASKTGRVSDLTEVWKSAVPAELHYTSWITDRAIDFLKASKAAEPFCLYVSYPDPHHPFTPPAPYCDLYKPEDMPKPTERAGELDRMPTYLGKGDDPKADAYIPEGSPLREQGFMLRTDTISDETMRLVIAHTYGMVKMIDDCVGRILTALRQTGSEEETIVLFTSDHGELLGDHGLLRKGPPPYRQLLQVPLVVSGPGIAAGARTQALTSHIDLFTTLADLLTGEVPETDGVSLAPVLSGMDDKVRDELFAEYHPRKDPELYNQTIVEAGWRLTLYPNKPGWGELFDLSGDPWEHHNLFHEEAYRPQVEALKARLSEAMPPQSTMTTEALGAY